MNNPYAKYLDGQDGLMAQNAAYARIRELGAKITPEKSLIPFAEGKWNASQILLHLAQCEMMFGTRYRQAVTIPNYQLQSFEQDDWMRFEPLLDFSAALESFLVLRALNLNWLNHLTAEQKQLPIIHPDLGTGVVQDLINIAAGHDLNHIGHLEVIAGL